MQITKRSRVTSIVHTLDIPVTQEQMFMYQCGMLIQDVMPNLTASDREFIKTGITPEEWAYFIANDDDSEGSE